MYKIHCLFMAFLLCTTLPIIQGCSLFNDSDTLTVEQIVKRTDSDRLLAHSRANPQESPLPDEPKAVPETQTQVVEPRQSTQE